MNEVKFSLADYPPVASLLTDQQKEEIRKQEKVNEILSQIEEHLPLTTPEQWKLQPDHIVRTLSGHFAAAAGGFDAHGPKMRAKHIALCSPDNMQTIIDYIRRLEKALGEK